MDRQALNLLPPLLLSRAGGRGLLLHVGGWVGLGYSLDFHSLIKLALRSLTMVIRKHIFYTTQSST